MKKTLTIILFLFLLIGCKSEPQADYLTEIPTTVIDNILKDRLSLANTKMKTLKKDVVNFTKKPTVATLKKAQDSYKDLAFLYGKLYVFNIGEAKDNFFNRRFNFWPVYNIAIEKVITEGKIDETKFINFGSASKNLPGMQYLLFKYDNNEKIVEEFSVQDSRKKYLTLVINELEKLFISLNDVWFGGGNYAQIFKSQNKQGLQGAFNLLYNGMYNVVDTDKVTKIGKPAGLESSPHTNPEIVEAFYSGQSLALIKSNLQSIEELFFSNKITNIASYIESITKNKEITSKLRTQLDECFRILATINVPLKVAVNTEKDKLKKLHKAYSNLLVIMNSDIRSVLSIVITGTDNDGD